MTATVAEGESLIEAARRANRILQVGHLERFNAAVQAVQPILTVPRFIESARLAPFKHRGTDVDVVLDLMIHDIDLILSIVRSPVMSVDAIGTSVFSNEIDIANARLAFCERLRGQCHREPRQLEDRAPPAAVSRRRLCVGGSASKGAHRDPQGGRHRCGRNAPGRHRGDHLRSGRCAQSRDRGVPGRRRRRPSRRR